MPATLYSSGHCKRSRASLHDSVEPVLASDLPTFPISFPATKHVQAKAAVDHVVVWLDAASTIKDLKLAPIAKRTWARVLAGPVGEILSNMTDSLRSRLNVASMLVFRSSFASLPMKDVSINIWIDASHQWRSRELLAPSFDLVVAQGDGAPKFERRLFPMLRIGMVLRTAIGKMRSIALANLVAVWDLSLRTRVLSCRTSCQSRRTKVRSVCWQTCLTCSLPSLCTSVLLCQKRLSLENGFFLIALVRLAGAISVMG